MPEGSHFAEKLRERRETAGLSQYALAKRSGLTKQALSRLEMGEREPTWNTVQRLAAALGVDCRAFVDPNLTLPPERPPARRGRPPKVRPEAPAAPQKKPRGRKKGK
jgi:transcriptional regulator with XRE-family HTH domain